MLGGLVGVAITPQITKGEQQQSKKKVLKASECPKCGYWIHLPVIAEYQGDLVVCAGGSGTTDSKDDAVWGRYRAVPITCSCPKCGYEEKADIMCTVIPRVE